MKAAKEIKKFKEEIANFITADKVKRAEITRRYARDKIKELWEMLGNIKVRCPHCGFVQSCQTLSRVECHNCGRKYAVMPEREPSRIVEVPKGKLWILHTIRWLEKKGRYPTVF